MNTTEQFSTYGIHIPELLLPQSSVDIEKWAVIACDQYTQDRDYWKQAADFTAGSPSLLNIILPEVYLEDGDRQERLENIRFTMNKYLSDGVFASPLTGMMYIERKTGFGRLRKGLVTAIDLEAYDWRPDSKALIRATEATITDRIPPRMEIRRGAPLESPHIMLLADDPRKALVEGLGSRVREQTPAYSSALMFGSGEITGWTVTSPEDLAYTSEVLKSLAEQHTAPDGSCFLFAVGDGNHSLATAKAVWDEYKSAHPEAAGTDHPARYALVEIVNLYDDGLTFEPIHRVLFGTNSGELALFLRERLGGSIQGISSPEELEQLIASKDIPSGITRFGFAGTSNEGIAEYAVLETTADRLAVSLIQKELDAYLELHRDVKIDYIHGADEVFRLSVEPHAAGILLPPVEKNSFFDTIANGGPLPRKSFSMGEASEKRFYMECRKLV
ncbi:MAG: DUF1015 domain-containing protein [Spirochaetaceae bacterium]|jgi:uncharacterized protein (DUF1015 family)|nr:DUF1015 domain-containing protein [Spirochaetaceae bacterium]